MISITEFIDKMQQKNIQLQTHDIVVVDDGDDDSPWIVRILIGVGAWIASLFFLGFVVLAFRMQIESMIVPSIILGGLAFALQYKMKNMQQTNIFIRQLSLAFIIAAQIGFILWSFDIFRGMPLLYTALVILVEALLFVFYKEDIQHFLSVITIYGVMLEYFIMKDMDVVGMNLVMILAAAVALVLFLYENKQWLLQRRQFLVPAAYASVITLLAMPTISYLLRLAHKYNSKYIITLLPALIAVTVMLVFMVYHIYRYITGLSKGLVLYVIVGLAVVLAAITFKSAGIVTALFVLILGHYRSSIVVKGFAVVMLIVFLFAFYYDMQVDLLNKSILLIGSGITMLVFRKVLNKFITATEEG